MDGLFGESAQSGSAPSRADLRAELAQRNLPRHLALFYESMDEQMDAVTAYLEHGLTTNHKCLYLVDVSSPAEIRDALATSSIDVEGRIDAGDLAVRNATDVYLDGGFAPERMIQTIEEACRDSLAAGYDGLWVAGENSWCFHTEMTFDHILDFEADFDATCPDLPVTALCQYDLTRFSEESAAKALWTHENVIYRNLICENPFYIPPNEYRSGTDAQLNVRLMLEQAYSLTRAHREVKRHEQRLEVVSRVLRHNIRNDLNVVQSNLQLLRDAAPVSDAADEKLDNALQHVTEVVEMADKARYVQETLATSTVKPVHLGSMIETAVEQVRSAHPDADITVAGPQDLSVVADTNLDMALSEALRNGIVTQEAEQPAVSLTVSTPTQDTVGINIRSPGLIPDSEQQPIRQGYETQLNHVSGLSLWLVQWTVENSYGRVTFPDADDSSAELHIELTRIPA